MTSPLLTEAEAAEWLGWSTSNLRARRARLTSNPDSDAAPKSIRVGGAVRYPSPEIRRWLQRHPEYRGRDRKIEQTLSQDEVCELLQIGRSTLRDRRSQLRDDPDSDAAPDHLQVGQEIRYRKSAVQDWIRRQRDM